ncbi:hypothetical protein PHJA_001420200 [Phtheirospermum japonicum]|uniref:Uncharacterized protein n=1 Tax=Phtheirospermum japonicum TaxID=374723 RepID=A0A830C181_9LAMI|nr:hypothetical protein PHJA_001420200 [Phtheirospermum japonicum]
MDMEELMTYSNNLIELLKEEKDVAGLKNFLRQSEALESQCVKDSNEAQRSIEGYVIQIHFKPIF